MVRIRNFAGMVLLLLVVIFAFSACSKQLAEKSQETPKTQVTLTVSAAASLKDAMNEIKDIYAKEVPDVNVTYNFASSGSLQQQIENGADVDVFISAANKQMDALETKGLLENGTKKTLLGNSLVLIIPKDSSLVSSFEDLTKDTVKKIGLGEFRTVPAGQYAEDLFTNMKILDKITAKAVYGKSVKEVLTWVETGNVDAGVVYLTDAKVSQKVKQVAVAPEESHKPIVYPASVIKSSKHMAEAKAFMDFLSGAKAKSVFEKYGFTFLANAQAKPAA
ncbi:MAG: ModA [Desulfotomaculum sp. 46_80]|nr:MAG: ModA [Desulfotomaculum sp. 46_80]